MNDENKKTDFPEENQDHDEFEDSFEDAFGIDEAPLQEPLTEEEIQAQEHEETEKASIERPVKKSGSMLPAIIGLAVIGFLGWKLYGFLGPKLHPTVETKPPSTAVPTDMGNLPTTAETSTTPGTSSTREKQLPVATTSSTTMPVEPVQAPPTRMPVQPAQIPSTNEQLSISTIEPPTTAKPTVEPTSIPAEPGINATANQKAPSEISDEKIKATDIELTKIKTIMQDQEKSYKQQIQALEKQVTEAKQSINNSTRALSAVQQDLNQLTSAVQQLSSQMTRLQEDSERQEIRRQQQTEQPKVKKQHSEANQLPSLTVYAIIPGRAWLRSANGKTITVAEGDPIGEYGKVLKIDASSGVVITTSGVTLR